MVKGSTLSQARSNYADQCSVSRVDCDPFNGEWFCASFRINSSTPPALTVFDSPSAPAVPSAPVVTEPVITQPAPVVSQPAPVVVSPPQPAPVPEPQPVAQPVAQPVVQPAPQPVAQSPAPVPDCARASSDSDGDGFGFENNATCLVTDASAPLPAPIAPTPAVVASPPAPRPHCVSDASDSDGDGFGFENNATCLVTAESTPTIVTPQTSPTNQTLPATKTSADITDLILVTGQSNALGAGTAFDPALDAPHERVFAFTNDGWRVANLHQIWDLNWHPRNHPNTDPSNNFGFHFAKRVAEEDSSRVIGFILSTAPGAAISHWNPNGAFYAQVQNKVLDAINQLPHKNSLDGILWHQGETDGRDEQSYTDALYGLINHYRNEPWVEANAPFICGETKIQSVNNRLNGLNRDSDPTTACVAGMNLTDLGDNRHFDAIALRTLGARYAEAYLQISP